MSEQRLGGKVALVIGAGGAGNMGQVIAQALTDAGARVLVAARRLEPLRAFADKIGGWAEAFCQVGATGFVGPYWPVSDGVARKAALIFYRSLQAGETVGEAMIRIRQRFMEDDEDRHHPSWLAYSLHCHPNVRVELAGQPPNGG